MWKFTEEDIIIEPKSHQKTLVWIHGWSRYPKQDERIFRTINFLPDTKIRLVKAPVHIFRRENTEIAQPTWFFSYFLKSGRPAYLYSLQSISRYIDDILFEEFKKCQNLYLAGYSQGGATALYTGLNSSRLPLKGIIALSCFPLVKPNPERNHIPVYIHHGDLDVILPSDRIEKAYKSLYKEQNYVFKVEKGLGHQYSVQEFKDVTKWINSNSSKL